VLALRHDEPGDYVFASGAGRTVGDLVDAAFAAAGVERQLPDGRDRVEIDQRFVRAPEPWPPVGDPSVARTVLGWRPRTSFEQLVGEMVKSDLARLGVARDSSTAGPPPAPPAPAG
jgi:GDPmannose 4,6-dehydratase